jgi:hypothetical protein
VREIHGEVSYKPVSVQSGVNPDFLLEGWGDVSEAKYI